MASRMWYLKYASPFNIQRRLSSILMASMVIILILSGVSLHQLYSNYIIERAEADAVSISQSFLAANYTLLLPPSNEGVYPLDKHSLRIEKLDEAFRLFLPPFHVIKLKVFSTDGTIIFSTDPSLIGQIDRENINLNKALAGLYSSKMQTKNEITDLQFEPRFNVDVVETYVPIYSLSGGIIGSFEIYQDISRFRDDVIRGVILAISVLAVILLIVFLIAFKMIKLSTTELVLVQNELQRLASIDSLTSIYNRYYILKQLKIEVARILKEKGELSTILFDLDFFKNINDNYGHQVGDKVLQQVAKTIQSNTREYDCVGRYGGEEFLVVLPNADGDKAAEIAERVRQSIENIIIKCDTQIIPISISAGVSTLRISETSIDQLINRADKALYAAKRNGRNQVMVAPPVVPVGQKMTTLLH